LVEHRRFSINAHAGDKDIVGTKAVLNAEFILNFGAQPEFASEGCAVAGSACKAYIEGLQKIFACCLAASGV
jgi:hypothetical protein